MTSPTSVRLPGIQSLLPEHIFRQFEHANADTTMSTGRSTAVQQHPLSNVSAMPRDVVSDEADDDVDDENQAEGLPAPGPGSYERDHVCIYCNRRCSRPSLLRVHMRIHTGVTPFQCPDPNCGRVFNVKSNMKRHYARHIPKNARASSNANPASSQMPQYPQIQDGGSEHSVRNHDQEIQQGYPRTSYGHGQNS